MQRFPSRRTFLGTTAAAASALAATASSASAARRRATNERLSIALIGCGGRMQSLWTGFHEHCDVAWVCDPDEQRCAQFREKAGASRMTGDLRRVLDDDSVDAVVIATPDHWHAPAAIMACNAGKHVYVEKPCSHNFEEGRLLVDAAKRNHVVVQHGTQSRSDPMIAGAVQMLREGIIGDVLMCKAWNVQRRRNIGKESAADPPPDLDYDTWVGPAEMVPFQKNRFHYDWHWWHNFGTGDIGNDGTHEIDMARWGLGVEGLPATVTGLGGKYYFDDDQEFPDTATCAFEWPGDGGVGQKRQLIFEMRIWSLSFPYNCDSGVEFYGTKGRLFLSKRGKLEVYADRNERVTDAMPKEPPQLARNHQVDFLNAISDGTKPSADVVTAFDSTSLVHLANIAVRIGGSLSLDPQAHQIIDNAAAAALLGRRYRDGGHWSVP